MGIGRIIAATDGSLEHAAREKFWSHFDPNDLATIHNTAPKASSTRRRAANMIIDGGMLNTTIILNILQGGEPFGNVMPNSNLYPRLIAKAIEFGMTATELEQLLKFARVCRDERSIQTIKKRIVAYK